jgi:hypothetical protein
MANFLDQTNNFLEKQTNTTNNSFEEEIQSPEIHYTTNEKKKEVAKDIRKLKLSFFYTISALLILSEYMFI